MRRTDLPTRGKPRVVRTVRLEGAQPRRRAAVVAVRVQKIEVRGEDVW